MNAILKLSVRYSINLKEYALSQSGYRFLEQLKKKLSNWVPSLMLNHQITMVTYIALHPNEVVIGFVSIGSKTEKTIYQQYAGSGLELQSVL